MFSGCGGLPVAQPNRAAEFTPPPSGGSPLAKVAGSGRAKGSSGFILMDNGWDSLACRCALADMAQETLNVQCFSWFDDEPAILMADRLLQAAQRGVNVRLLLDDLSIKVGTRQLALLDAHPNIEVRTYNPVAGNYGNMIRRNLQVAFHFVPMQRRMHNKQFMADRSMVLVGGRNVGDKYFDLSEDYNYRDREVLAVGPIATKLVITFDEYWNSPWSVELSRTISYRPKPGLVDEHLAGLEQRVDAATAKINLGPDLAAMSGRLTHVWSEAHRGTAEVICDEPGKNPHEDSLTSSGKSADRLAELALQVERELIIQTPYAVLTPGTFDLFRELDLRGVRIRILTNSKAASRNPFAVGAYREQRIAMLHGNVELFEVRPDAEIYRTMVKPRIAGQDEVPVSLHAKSGIFDTDHVYIGSFNLDPRSIHLNTELGLFIRSRSLNGEMRRIMEEECHPRNSWQVILGDDGKLAWTGWEEGKFVESKKEPEVTLMKKIMVRILSLLPTDPLL